MEDISRVIGREKELEEVLGVLSRSEAALVVVAGEAGMGKTTFLGEIESRATPTGWAVARANAGGSLCVKPTTTAVEFERRVREILAMPPGAPVQSPVRLLETWGTSDAPATREPADGDAPPSVIGRVIGAAVRSLRETWDPRLVQLVEDLQSRAPVLVLIDGYRPTETFNRWFTGRFVRLATHVDRPVVVIVAERRTGLGELTALASLTISLEALDDEPIREHLKHVGFGLEPPLGAEEVEAYVRAARGNPELVGSLSRLLAAARAHEDAALSRVGT